ncbi:adenine phosphoribosyltransferase [Pseudactinotalea sp.]|uniref:adenine phosphoribosyltransferase n=1 Tax=Pseudactinotalea sp. TaxID=1926260 RepID=UPI003B3BB755
MNETQQGPGAVARAAEVIAERTRLTPDFPEPGVLFRDLTPVLCHPDSLAAVADAVAALGGEVDLFAALEARGFLLGAAAAVTAAAGVLPLRKPGKLPGTGTSAVLSQSYDLEYGTAALELQPADVPPGARVLVVDDVLATGGTAAAAVELVRRAGGDVTGVVVALELLDLGGRARIPADVPVHAITAV